MPYLISSARKSNLSLPNELPLCPITAVSMEEDDTRVLLFADWYPVGTVEQKASGVRKFEVNSLDLSALEHKILRA